MSEPNIPPPPSYTPPPPPSGFPPSGGGTVSPNRTIMIVLAYLGPFALIPFFVEKDDREIQWHAKHGLVLFGIELILCIALFIVSWILTSILTALGCLAGILQLVVGLGILVLHILCIVKGVNGQRFLIPGISQYADRF